MKKLIKKINKNINISIYKYNFLTKFSKLNLVKKYNLNIKRVLSYGKLFLRLPSKFMKHKYGFNKSSALTANKTLFRTFLFSFYNKKIYRKIAKFTYNIFFVINLSIKLNFGLSLSLIRQKNYFFLTIENYINKYFLFINKLFKNKTNNLIKKSYFYNKLLVNLLQYKLTNKNYNNIKKIFKNKIKIFNYCYKGLSLKIFRYHKKY
jgi:hypothetical protein